jgi:hypothetical protein
MHRTSIIRRTRAISPFIRLNSQKACIEFGRGAPIMHVPTDVGAARAQRIIARLMRDEAPTDGIVAQ